MLVSCSRTDLSGMPPPAMNVQPIVESSIQVTTDTVFLSTRPVPTRIKAKNPTRTAANPFYPMVFYTTENGLPLDPIYSSLADRKGYIWFGTAGGGASRFDGKGFTTFSSMHGLVGISVRCILEDNSGNILFGTDSGVSVYDGKSITTLTKPLLPSQSVRALYQDRNGKLWVGTEDGVPELPQLGRVPVRAIVQDESGDMWIGTGNGLSRYSANALTKMRSKEEGLSVRSLFIDKSQRLWVGTTSGLRLRDGNELVEPAFARNLHQATISSITQDSKGNLWFVTRGSGAYRYDGQTLRSYTRQNGLSSDTLNSVTEDKGGNIWFSSDGAGAIKFSGETIAAFSPDQGLPSNYVLGITQDGQKQLWLATSDGMSVYDGKTFSTWTKEHGLADNFVTSVAVDKNGTKWFSTANGITRFDGQEFTNYSTDQGFANDSHSHVFFDRSGDLWFAHERGASRLSSTKVTNFSFTSADKKAISVDAIIQGRNGDIWFASSAGLIRFDGKSFTSFRMGSMAQNRIRTLFEDDFGNLWIGTALGLFRFDGKSLLSLPDQMLSHPIIWFVRSTKEGHIVVGTNEGISVITGFSSGQTHQDAQNKLSNHDLKHFSPDVEIYNVRTGFPLKDAVTNSFHRDENNTLWFATGPEKFALVRFDYASVKPSKATLTPLIDSVKIDNERVVWSALIESPPEQRHLEESLSFGSTIQASLIDDMRNKFSDIKFDSVSPWYATPKNLILPYRHNKVELSYVAVDIDQPLNIYYQYKLEGSDFDWIGPTKRTLAIYNNLDEGEYSFKVRAKRGRGEWGHPVSYNFTVQPPWYRTWWAYVLYGTLTVFVLFVLYRWRTAKLRKRQEELEELYHSAERFLPKNFLQILNKSRFQEVNLGDTAQVEKQVMFSDIRGFTNLTERLGPERTALVLNTYMGYMAPIVRQYDGVVGQFLGDGILAFFEPDPEMAIDAALAMLDKLGLFNNDIEKFGLTPVEIGIGLNLGRAVFSIIGEPERLEGHVISDSVNLSARIESLNKFYKTTLLITGAVYDRLVNKDKYLIRLIDNVFVVGKDQSVKIYEVMSFPQNEDLQSAKLYFSMFEKAFSAYASGDFAQALELFGSCLTKRPTDHVPVILMERCAQFLKSGAPTNWNGTYKLSEK